MTGSIEKNTLIEIEFELNRKDILHCRSLIVDAPTQDTLVVLAPPPVEHGYIFKAGDQIDLYCSLLSSGDFASTLHIKAHVSHVTKNEKGTLLHLKRSGFERRIAVNHFFILRSKASILLERADSASGAETVPAIVHSVSLTRMHITSPVPLNRSGIWHGYLELNGSVFSVQGKAEPEENSSINRGHAAVIRFSNMSDENRLQMAKTIEAIQKSCIEARIGTTYHGILERSSIQDTVILEHLVPRSQQRIALDLIEAAGWLILILISFDIIMALPPGSNLFDRFFQVQRSVVWDRDQLRFVPYYLGIEALLCSSAFAVHQYIYFRGNTRRRFTLWILSFLVLLAFLTVLGRL